MCSPNSLRFGFLWALLILCPLLPAHTASGKDILKTRVETRIADQITRQTSRLENLLQKDQPDQLKVSLYLNLSQLYERLKRPDRAIEALEQARSLPEFKEYPDSQRVMSSLSRLYISHGKPESAADALLAYLGPTPGPVGEATAEETLRPREANLFPLERDLFTALLESGYYAKAKQELLVLARAPDRARSTFAYEELIGLYEQGHMSDREIGLIADPLLNRLPDQALRLAGILADRKRPSAADYFYSELLEKKPDVVLRSAEQVATFYEKRGTLDRLLQEMAGEPSSSPGKLRLLARFYRFKGKTDQAARLLEELARKEGSPVLRAELGELYMATGEYDRAIQAYRSYVAATAFSPSGYQRLGEAYFLAGKVGKARQMWSRIPELTGHSSGGYASLSDIYNQHGFDQEAIAAMQEAVRRTPGTTYYANRLISMYLAAGRYGEAIAELMSLSGAQQVLYFSMVDVFLGNARDAQARDAVLTAARTALRKAPGPARTLLLEIIFQIYLRDGRYEEAVAEAKRGGSGSDQRLYLLGESLRKYGERTWAVRALEAVPDRSVLARAAHLLALDILSEEERPDRARQVSKWLLAELTRNASAAATIAAASKNAHEVLSQEVEAARTWGRSRRADLGRVLLALARVSIQERRGEAALVYLFGLDSLPDDAQPSDPRRQAEKHLAWGEAYAILGDRGKARTVLEIASTWRGPAGQEAGFLLCELDLWDEDLEAAAAGFQSLCESGYSQDVINDALQHLFFLGQLRPNESHIYAQAASFAWHGRYKDAAERYRTLAAKRAEDSLGEWCLFEVGRLLLGAGEVREAEKQFGRLLEATEDAVLAGRVRLEILAIQDSKPDADPGTVLKGYRELIEETPDSIFADDARREISS